MTKFLKSRVLEDLGIDNFDDFKKKPHVVEYKNSEYVFRTSDEADRMYLILEGYIKITLDLSDGREQILYIYKADDFVGGLNLLSGDRYLYNGITINSALILEIYREDFDMLLKNNRFLKKILEQSYVRIRKSEELIDRLSVINGDMKVAKLLIDLIKIYGKKENGNILLDLNINREELGSYSGVSRETMSRKLNYFEDIGLIKLLPKGKILLLDIQGLRDLTI